MARPQPSRSSAGRKPEPMPIFKLGPAMIFVTIILVLMSFGCGYGALTVQSMLSNPLTTSNATRPFVVAKGDALSSTIPTKLEQQKFIRSATIFKLYLRIKGAEPSISPGTYQLSSGWTLQQIISALAVVAPLQYVAFTIPEGQRLTQYPDSIITSAHKPLTADQLAQTPTPTPTPATLPNFDKAQFLQMVQTGQFASISKYWYVTPWKAPAPEALEGYLIPGTYLVNPDATTEQIIDTMLDGFGQLLCPSDTDDPNAYIYDQTQCKVKQHLITPPDGVEGGGDPIGVFDSLTKHNLTIPQALILASIAQREARQNATFFNVVSVLYNRVSNPDYETAGTLGADPTIQYEIGTTAAAGTDPWAPLPAGYSPGDPSTPNTPYNSYQTAGYPPSAISGPGKFPFYAGIDPPSSPYYYYFASCPDGANIYSKTDAENQNQQYQHGILGVNC